MRKSLWIAVLLVGCGNGSGGSGELDAASDGGYGQISCTADVAESFLCCDLLQHFKAICGDDGNLRCPAGSTRKQFPGPCKDNPCADICADIGDASGASDAEAAVDVADAADVGSCLKIEQWHCCASMWSSTAVPQVCVDGKWECPAGTESGSVGSGSCPGYPCLDLCPDVQDGSSGTDVQDTQDVQSAGTDSSSATTDDVPDISADATATGGKIGDSCTGSGQSSCGAGLVCCYPCGIPGCQNKCAAPCSGPGCFSGCPALP